jgi:hypothetical protein
MRAGGHIFEIAFGGVDLIRPDVIPVWFCFVCCFFRLCVSDQRTDIVLDKTGRTASVTLPDNTNYKGVMMKPAIAPRGQTHISFKLKFTSTVNADHIALGVGNASFNTTKNCPEGWTTGNAGWCD